jgi:hypothetical protein
MNEPMKINIELPAEEAEGTYANLVILSHSSAEFVLDFTRVLPGTPKTKVYSRIIMAPQHAKGLLRALTEDIEKYEKEFGDILDPNKDTQKGYGFNVTPSSNEQKH